MDDFLIIHHNREYLEECMRKVVDYLRQLKFGVNPKKTKIYTLSKGIEFLGFKFSLTDTGKVLMQIRPDNVKRERKKLARLVKRCRDGLLPRSSVDASYQAWRTHASKGNNYNMICRMDEYYKSLWAKGVNNGTDLQDGDDSQRTVGT
jgi:hypothetical protein